MESIISELGVYMTSSQHDNLVNIINNVLQGDIKHIKLTCSSGNSIVIINENDPNVIYQYFLHEKMYNKVFDVCLQRIDGFVQMITFYNNYQLLVFERVEPLVNIVDNTCNFNLLKLLNDIFHTLITMKKLNISHNDLTLDNIGYSKIHNRYLVYDFESVKFETKESNDLYSLLKSINFHESVNFNVCF